MEVDRKIESTVKKMNVPLKPTYGLVNFRSLVRAKQLLTQTGIHPIPYVISLEYKVLGVHVPTTPY